MGYTVIAASLPGTFKSLDVIYGWRFSRQGPREDRQQQDSALQLVPFLSCWRVGVLLHQLGIAAQPSIVDVPAL